MCALRANYRKKNYRFTSESVSEGHPDKLCDQISDTILDAALTQNVDARVACETFATTKLIVVGGETNALDSINPEQLARDVLRDIGYNDPTLGIDYKTCEIINTVHEQSPDIARGIYRGPDKAQGAGDQGSMFGYACHETDCFMPTPIDIANKIMIKAREVRKSNRFPFLSPDGKCQVSVRYVNNQPDTIETIVLSQQHSPEIDQKELREILIEEVINTVIPKQMSKSPRYIINPTGRFVVGGPHGDTGLTGRKLMVDTYGGKARHGGGAFSGKDPSKVDRSASYMARYIAKNIVASRVCTECEVQLAYAIGLPDPVSLYVETYGTSIIEEHHIETAVRKLFDLTPQGIVSSLRLARPIYRTTATYGHFGREQFPWEKIDRIEEIRQELM